MSNCWEVAEPQNSRERNSRRNRQFSADCCSWGTVEQAVHSHQGRWRSYCFMDMVYGAVVDFYRCFFCVQLLPDEIKGGFF